jgi:hypothetical protein
MIHTWGNVIEGIFWIVLAVIVAARTRSLPRPHRRIGLGATVALVVFGVSDFVEVSTGAWYRPIWLLVLKCVCLVVLVGCLFGSFRTGRSRCDSDVIRRADR